MSFYKVSRKIPEKLYKMFIHKMWHRETWSCTGGLTELPHHGQARATPGRALARCGTPWPSTYLPHSHTPAHTRRTPPTCSKHEFLLLVFPIFDLFAQPPICSEIWSICSLVCDSPVHPSRILSSGVHLEYFATVGDMLCELACLIYAYLSCFDACLVLIPVPILFPFNCLS